MPARIARGAVLAVAALVAAAGCQRPALLRYEADVDAAPAPAAHAVHEARLSALMRELEGLRSDRLPKALDPAAEVSRQAAEVGAVAAAMARSARSIGAAAPAGLGPEAQADFDARAKQLAEQSDRLARSARRADPRDPLAIAALSEQVRAIDATCAGCHTRHRIPGLPDGAD